MKIDKACKIEKCVEKPRGVYRERLAHPYLDMEPDASGKVDPHIVATDSYKLVAIPVDVSDEDCTGHIPVDAVKASRKNGGEIVCNGSARTGGVEYPRPDAGDFINWRMLIPEPGANRIGINAKYLYELAQAMGSDTVELAFVDGGDGGINAFRPMVVKPLHSAVARDAKGLLMPVRLSK